MSDKALKKIWIFRFPCLLWAVALALYICLETSQVPAKYIAAVNGWIEVILIFSVTIVLANLLQEFLKFHLTAIQSPLAQSGILYGIIRGIVILIGLLLILGRLGIHIEALLTAFGVGGLAVSLALQDTLGNLFAGISLLIDRAIRVGDRVKLETGQEGDVVDIGWRTTRIRVCDSEDLIVIPNTKLAQGISIRRAEKISAKG